MTLKRFAKHVSWALIPGKPPLFARSRWNRWDASIDYVGLLAGTHGLLKTLYLKHVGAKDSANKPDDRTSTNPIPEPIQPPLQADPDAELDDFFLEAAGLKNKKTESERTGHQQEETAEAQNKDSKDEHEHGEQEQHQDQSATATFDWAKFNKQKKQEAKEWVKTNPFARLCCTKQIAAELMDLMYKFLQYSGGKWENKQRYLSSKGMPRSYVVLEAAKGLDVEKCMINLYGVLYNAPPCVSVHDYDPLLKALRFRMVACALSSLQALLRLRRSQFPFKLFTALESREQAQVILDAPSCSHDPLAHAILTEYDIWLKLLQSILILNLLCSGFKVQESRFTCFICICMRSK